jgi:hypothetical protein
MIKSSLFMICLFPLAIISLARKGPEERMVVIGMNSMHESMAQSVPLPVYRKSLTTALSSVHDSIIPVLEKKSDPQTSGVGWHLNSVGVGLGLGEQLGLGPLLFVTFAQQLRLVFSNSTKPIYPN